MHFTKDITMTRRMYSAATIAGFLSIVCLTGAREDEAKSVFSDTTMDLGIVVSDLDASLSFYTDVVGLKKTGGFSVPGAICKTAGLSDGHDLAITILTPNGDSDGTNLKLMAVPEADSKPSDNKFIHSQLGFSYLTFYVADLDAAIARAKESGTEFAGADATPVGGGNSLSLVRDPDGNLIELVGPRGK